MFDTRWKTTTDALDEKKSLATEMLSFAEEVDEYLTERESSRNL